MRHGMVPVVATQMATIKHQQPTLATASQSALLHCCRAAVCHNQPTAYLALQRATLEEELSREHLDTPRAAAASLRTIATGLNHLHANYVHFLSAACNQRFPSKGAKHHTIAEPFQCDWLAEQQLLYVLALLYFDNAPTFRRLNRGSNRPVRASISGPMSHAQNCAFAYGIGLPTVCHRLCTWWLRRYGGPALI